MPQKEYINILPGKHEQSFLKNGCLGPRNVLRGKVTPLICSRLISLCETDPNESIVESAGETYNIGYNITSIKKELKQIFCKTVKLLKKPTIVTD